MPGRAAFVDGRGGSSMRLNFSGVDEDDIREGIRRIGEVVREQVELYGTLTGVARRGRRAASRRAEPRAAAEDALRRDRRKVLPPALASARVEPDRGPEGRPLARAPGVAEVGRPGPGRARAARPRGRSPIDVGADLVERLTDGATRAGLRRAARPRRRGRHRAGAARGDGHPVHRLGRLGLHPRRRTRCWPSTPCATRRSRRRTSTRSARPRSRSWAPRRPCRRSRSGSSSRSWSSRRRRARRWGSSSRARRRTCRARSWRRSPTTARCCSSATSPAATWPCRSSTRTGAASAADRRGGPRAGGLLRLRGPLRDRPHPVRVPGGAGRRSGRACRARSRSRSTRCSGAPGSRAWT